MRMAKKFDREDHGSRRDDLNLPRRRKVRKVFSRSIPAGMPDSGISDVPSNLFSKTAPIDVPDTNCRPAKLSHHARKVPIATSRSLTLRDLQDVHQHLRADALQPIEPCRSAHAFQAQSPRVYVLCGFEFDDGSFHAL